MPARKKTTEKTNVTSKKATRKTTRSASSRRKDNIELFSPVQDDVMATNTSRFNVKKSKLFLIPVVLLGLLLLGLIFSKYAVVAWVDKKPIFSWDYYKTLDTKYGKDIKDQLIVQKLVQSEADKRKVSVTQDDLNNEINKIQQEQGGADKLNQVLQLQGISQDEFKNLVKLQIMKQRMFAENITVSDDEVNKYIEENKAQLPEVDDKLKMNLKEELKQQKINTNFNNWLKEVMDSPRVSRV